MAQYRLSAQIIKRTSGHSATAAAAYRAGAIIVDQRTGVTHDYSRKGGVMHSEIRAPEDAPDWMRDRAKLWNAVEKAEKRYDAQLAREIQLSLPHELDKQRRLQLVRSFIDDQFVSEGMIADFAIHEPDKKGDSRNYHAHILLSTRSLFGDGFGNKNRDWNDAERLVQWREAWAKHQNTALPRHVEEVSHLSLADQGIERIPQIHKGKAATQAERKGQWTPRVVINDNIKVRNTRFQELSKANALLGARLEWERDKAETSEALGRGQLAIDKQRNEASKQIGRLVRKKTLEKLLDADFGGSTDHMTMHFDLKSLDPDRNIWLEYIDEATKKTRAEKQELDRLEAQLSRKRAQERAQAVLERKAEQQRIAKERAEKASKMASDALKSAAASSLARSFRGASRPPEGEIEPITDEFNRVAAQPPEKDIETTGDDAVKERPPSPAAAAKEKDPFDKIDDRANDKDRDPDRGRDR